MPVSDLVKRLRAKAAAEHDQLDDGIPGVIADGIWHLAEMCKEAADALETKRPEAAGSEDLLTEVSKFIDTVNLKYRVPVEEQYTIRAALIKARTAVSPLVHKNQEER